MRNAILINPAHNSKKNPKTEKRCAVCSKHDGILHDHHTLRDEPPYNEVQEGSDYTGHWRNNPLYRQWLCEDHHLTDAHELFEDTRKWPEGFGTADNPFRRGDPEVEKIINERRVVRDKRKEGCRCAEGSLTG